ncbi:class I SAM-dependent methyltransferase [Alginatibacterium sediminis]|uniref:Class I SAM-dependent methyltransferase n=1 Tax=Alginatibacterium sediminis TaxID=2164068 RepID=A0A420E6I3_9ALTE|nr:class I SAM-dependent methyltransferase [Alginatibacterium sediminis]RKF13290.1 class I SAM-dependent methyltransferase [Alginatibacterium sediminis]
MSINLKPSSQVANGRLWGVRAQDWANIQEATCYPVYLEAFKRLKTNKDSHYLDLGCGAGQAALLAQQHGAIVKGLDASEQLLTIAKHRVPDGQFHIGDLETLPFSDNTFDIVTSFNAVQYAANPSLALQEAQRVTKPGGLVLVMTWGEPEGMQAASLVAALKPLLPPPPPGAPGPFALSLKSVLKQFASAAQLSVLEIFDVDCVWHYPDLDTGVRGLGSSGVSVKAAEHSGQDAVDLANATALGPFKTLDGSYKIQAKFRCLLSRV